MKRVLAMTCCLVSVLCLLAPLPAGAASPSPTPGQLVEQMMDEIKAWQVPKEKPENWPRELDAAWRWADLLGESAQPLLQKLEYEIGNSKITGNRAVVDLSLTAPDIRGIARDIAIEAAAVFSITRLLNKPVDFSDQLRRRVSSALESNDILCIRTDLAVYLVRGGDGRWKIDLSDKRNFDFIAALFPSLWE